MPGWGFRYLRNTMPTPFQNVLRGQTRRFPLWQVQDVYKLILQAAMGSEHAMINREHARIWLEQEMSFLMPVHFPEPLIEPINPGGSIVRLNLRPFTKLKQSSELLLEVFLRTSAEFFGSTVLLDSYASQAVEIAGELLPGSEPHELENFLTEMKEKGYPSVHHSKIYTNEYAPAYRVIVRSFLPQEWLEIG